MKLLNIRQVNFLLTFGAILVGCGDGNPSVTTSNSTAQRPPEFAATDCLLDQPIAWREPTRERPLRLNHLRFLKKPYVYRENAVIELFPIYRATHEGITDFRIGRKMLGASYIPSEYLSFGFARGYGSGFDFEERIHQEDGGEYRMGRIGTNKIVIATKDGMLQALQFSSHDIQTLEVGENGLCITHAEVMQERAIPEEPQETPFPEPIETPVPSPSPSPSPSLHDLFDDCFRYSVENYKITYYAAKASDQAVEKCQTLKRPQQLNCVKMMYPNYAETYYAAKAMDRAFEVCTR